MPCRQLNPEEDPQGAFVYNTLEECESECCDGTCINALGYLVFDFTEEECLEVFFGSWSGFDCGIPYVDPCWTLGDAVAFYGAQPTSYAYIGPNSEFIFEPQDCGNTCVNTNTGCGCCPNT